ncbi:hypothetical protein EON83_04095 [bacterium]|nr:MAG: hypothetical protein EON83_04095 [bacterium]
MKRPLRAREIAFILLPALGLGAFALYQRRLEQVRGPRRSDGIYVSSFEMKRAKGRFQAEGLSHEVTVTIAHSWPRPKWWGAWSTITNLNPLDDVSKISRTINAPGVVAYGAALTTTSIKNGKPIIKQQWLDNRIGFPMRDNQIVISHPIALDKIPLSAGEVTFRGMYLIAGREPIRINRVVRKVGEKSYQPPDRNTNGRLISIQAGNFTKQQTPPTATTQDNIQIDFLSSRTFTKAEKLQIVIDDLKLHDANNKTFIPYRTPGFTVSWGGIPIEDSTLDTTKQTIWLTLAPTIKTTNPLVLKGQVNLDDGWPIPFSVRLPKR